MLSNTEIINRKKNIVHASIIDELTPKEISKLFGYSINEVYRILKLNNIKYIKKSEKLSKYKYKYINNPNEITFKHIKPVNKTKIKYNNIINDYKNGMTFIDIGIKYNHSRTYIRKILINNNINVKKESHTTKVCRKYNINIEDIYKAINAYETNEINNRTKRMNFIKTKIEINT